MDPAAMEVVQEEKKDENKKEEVAITDDEKMPQVKPSIYTDITRVLSYIIKGVESNQPRFILKAIRQNSTIRKHATKADLVQLIALYIPSALPVHSQMMEAVEKLKSEAVPSAVTTDSMEVEVTAPAATTLPVIVPLTVLPEVEIYIFTTLVVVLLREQLHQEAAYYSNFLIDRIRTFNRRSLDLISAKAYYYFSLSYEMIGKLENIRAILLALYRTTCIRHDESGQAVLLNLILRNYLHYNMIEQAHTFSLRTTFSDSASNNQFCRYLYYVGRIQAVQLEYSEAYQRLMLAARKSPQDYATGFSVIVHKLAVIVQLLMGEIPEKRTFNQGSLRAPLQPYLALTQAVRNGDLQQFDAVVSKYHAYFASDKNLSLVKRLGHNVLKTGLRKISLSYSRIALADVAAKLHLPSEGSAEYICAKAIRDGVIDAKIDHANSWLVSTEAADVYSTEEPQNAFHKRIAFCLDVYNEALRSMRYPPDAYKRELANEGKSKGADAEKSIDELIREIEDNMEE